MVKKCGELMTQDPTWCLPTETVDKVAQIMKSEEIGSIPVVANDYTRKVIGIITDRDIALKIVAEMRDPINTKIEDIMSRHPITCHVDDDVDAVIDLMGENQLRRIPVINAEEEIVGIISR